LALADTPSGEDNSPADADAAEAASAAMATGIVTRRIMVTSLR
jgi:hypothetical protein